MDSETLATLVNNMYDEVIIYDDNYNIVFVNNACNRHYSCNPEDMIGKSFFDLTSNNWWEPSILPYIYKEKKAKAIMQKTFTGSELLTIAVPVFDDNKKIKYVVMNVRDQINMKDLYNPHFISEQINLEQAEIIFKSKDMDDLMRMIDKVGKQGVTCIISGESGTGKTMIARHMHSISSRKNERLICINCGSIPNELIETELFGYSGGAFTGASSKGKKGLFEVAHNGTILLDEISELPLAAQTKLLHVLQDKEFIPLGSSKSVKVDVRVIAATNKNLENMVESKQFRQDLYYRLKVVDLYIPPLRRRRDDIVPLIYHFSNIFSKKYKVNRQFNDNALEVLYRYDWPGNIRELQHVVERLFVTVDSMVIDSADLPKNVFGINDNDDAELKFTGSFDDKVEKYKAYMVNNAFKQNNSSRKLAKYFNISQTKANNLIKRYVK